jgi:hypothetical protein
MQKNHAITSKRIKRSGYLLIDGASRMVAIEEDEVVLLVV